MTDYFEATIRFIGIVIFRHNPLLRVYYVLID